ncbi:unnamed protein product [Calypogeia fissa]
MAVHSDGPVVRYDIKIFALDFSPTPARPARGLRTKGRSACDATWNRSGAGTAPPSDVSARDWWVEEVFACPIRLMIPSGSTGLPGDARLPTVVPSEFGDGQRFVSSDRYGPGRQTGLRTREGQLAAAISGTVRHSSRQSGRGRALGRQNRAGVGAGRGTRGKDAKNEVPLIYETGEHEDGLMVKW